VASDTLREAILSADLAPGVRLVETELAEEMGVSRGTVRAALSELKRDGLVEVQPYSSWAVAKLDQQTLWEVYTLRASLESGAARLLASRITADDKSAIAKAVQALEKAEETGKNRLHADLAFHALIVARCGNKMLQESYAKLAEKLQWIYANSEAKEPQRIDLVDWHESLVSALCSGQADAAAQIVFNMCMASLDDDLSVIPDFHSLRSIR
ncbi:MAG: GntR family transcriptional regulator, partial [Phycisphaerales bacterium]|nr:GntR family transcriptional regulator [Phycisphaerales bacterium]